MNARINDSDDRGGRESSIILPRETTKRYSMMLLQALSQKTEQAKAKSEQDIAASFAAARANLRRRDNAFRSWFLQKPLKEVSPATAYVQHLEEIEQAPTTLLSPLPTSMQHTDALDISLEATRIETNWNPYDMLAEMQCSPITERQPRVTKKLSVPLPGPLDMSPTHHNCYESECALRALVKTGVDLYIQDYECIPTLIEISTAARSLLPIIADWEEGYPYQSILIPIVGNPQLKANAVRCWGN